MRYIWAAGFLLLGAGFSAGAMPSFQAQELNNMRMAAGLNTLSQRELPVAFVNRLKTRAGLSAADKKMLIQSLMDWSKSYSKDISYENAWNRFSVLYKKHTVAAFEIVGYSPLKMKINSGTPVTLEKGREISMLLKAMEKAGYSFHAQQAFQANPFFNSAWAEEPELADSFKNSVVLATGMASDGLTDVLRTEVPASDYAKKLIHDGYMFPKGPLEILAGGRDTQMSCDGETAHGRVWMNGGTAEEELVDFQATRGQVIFQSNGMKVIGKAAHPASADVGGLCFSIDSELQHYGISDEEWPQRLSKLKADCNQIKKINPNLEVSCDVNQENYHQICSQVDAVAIVPPMSFALCLNEDCSRTRPIVGKTMSFAAIRALKKFESKHHANIESEWKRLSAKMSKESVEKFNAEDGKRLDEIGEYMNLAVLRNGFGYTSTAALGLLDCCHNSECRASMKKEGLHLKPADSAKESTVTQ